MLGDINKAFDKKKADAANDQFITESVLEDDLLDDLEDGVDSDSIPDEVMKRVDSELDKIIGDTGDLDDDEIEEMVDDEDIDDEEIEIALTEAAGKFWTDDENIGHPDTSRRSGKKHQPDFCDGCGE